VSWGRCGEQAVHAKPSSPRRSPEWTYGRSTTLSAALPEEDGDRIATSDPDDLRVLAAMAGRAVELVTT
jgi:hypothetical protein